MNSTELDRLCINTIRFLAVDAVEKAKSGHPGLPLDAAPMAYVLWTRFLRHNPGDPSWWDRDRFVLSAGHGSALLYALLHLTGYDLPMSELQRFRQWQSKTPGHPESHMTVGVEASTGPLGQGIGNALGLAMGEAHLSARYNRAGHELFHHFTYVLASDGDMMEGVQSEAASLAGHLGLGRLIVLYDSNRVTLSAGTSITFTEDLEARYRAYGWHVQDVADGNDLDAIERAIRAARDVTDRPSLISVRTILGYGAPDKQGSYHAHGSPLGADEVIKTKKNLGWPLTPEFFVPPEARQHLGYAVNRGRELQDAWQRGFAAYAQEHPELAAELRRRFEGELPPGWSERLPSFAADQKGMATRKASEAVLQEVARVLPELIGGSGDLDPSTYTWLKGQGDFEPPRRVREGVEGLAGGEISYAGRNLHFGVREHAMGAAVNGLVYHGGFVPFGATFLVFSDYMRPAIRLAGLARLHALFVFTHDSIGLGEDGPSHQPVEQLIALRAIPNLIDLRPCDANETRVAWQVAIEARNQPVALVLTRQSVPTLDRTELAPAEQLRRGGYVLKDVAGGTAPDIILMASGSEVDLIVQAEPVLRESGIKARLVSLPSWRLFAEQPASYQESVLPDGVSAKLAVEAASPLGWERWTGRRGAVIGVDGFGASAPGGVVLSHYGFSVDHVVQKARALVSGKA